MIRKQIQDGFKGFWIPLELMELKISWTKRILLAEISQLEMLDKGCVASNTHFSEKLKISKQAVSKALNEMDKDNLITIDNAQTKRNFGRTITINFSKSPINFSKSGVHQSVESKENKTNNKSTNTLIEEIVYMWNEFANTNSKHKILKLTGKRKNKLLERTKELKDYKEAFRIVLLNASKSEFCLNGNWFSFDWLIDNDTNLIKVFEGKYNEVEKGWN